MEKQFIELPLGLYTLEDDILTYNMEKYLGERGEVNYLIWTDNVFHNVHLFEKEGKITGMSGVGLLTVHGTVDIDRFNKITKKDE